MSMQLFGNNLKESGVEMTGASHEGNSQLEVLQAEVTQARKKLMDSEAKMIELQKRLDEYISKERQIAEVMIAAQISAQKTEAQARARAEVLLQETDEELRLKQQELELLQMRAQLLKDEIFSKLEQCKTSVDKIMAIGEDSSFTPTLVSGDKKGGHKLIGSAGI